MLRPATPLAILFFVAFVLLLLATISTPIVKAVPLASVDGVTFGVFGYCRASGCSKIGVGYSVDSNILGGSSNDNSDFSLSAGTRSTLSYILIVHPVAAFLTLVCFILAASAHLHSPSHSSRYLLGLLIVIIPTLLITLLAFLVDILLFIPHVAWGGWIVLASTILILASAVVTCAMRRTLVSRKARKKRIVENAEMNGENFYASQNPVPSGIRADSPPPLASGTLDGSDKLPTFTAYEAKTSTIDDDRVPLNGRTPSNKTLPSEPSVRGPPGYSDDGSERYGAQPARGAPRGGPRGMRGGRGGYSGPRDEYGNPLPPSNAFGPMPPAGFRRDRSEPTRVRRRFSDENMNAYGPPGRGRGFSRGGPYGPGRGGPGRGGIPMGPIAAGAGAGMRNRGPPPPDYATGYPPQRGPDYGPPAGYGRSPSAPGYGRARTPPAGMPPPGVFGRGSSPGPPSAPGGYRGPPPSMPPGPGGYGYTGDSRSEPPMQPYRAVSPTLPLNNIHPAEVIIGQAVEMDARHGSPSRSPHPEFAQPMQLRDSDSDVQGLIGLQQQQQHLESERGVSSEYSRSETYVPPRAAWTTTSTSRGMTPPPNTIALDPMNDESVELPTQTRPQQPRSNSIPKAPSHAHKASDDYYEDIEPRFAAPTIPLTPEPRHLPQQHTPATQSSATVPSALMPGLTPGPALHHSPIEKHNGEIIDPTSSYEDIPQSPTSDHSNMTSISQRGVNPQWVPDNPHGRLGVPSYRKPVQAQSQRDILLDSNPDFNLPGPGQRSRAGTGPTIVPQHGQAF